MPNTNPKIPGSVGEVERRLKNAVTAIRNARLELEASNVPFRTGWWERLERDAALELAEWQKRFGID